MGQTKFELANDIFFQCAQLNHVIHARWKKANY